MDTKTLPMGTVVEVTEKELEALIVGYTYQEIEQKLKMFYIVVPYPQGFAGVDSIKMVEPSEIRMKRIGYESNYAKRVTTAWDGLNQIAEKVSADEMKSYLKNALEGEA